MWTHGSNSSQFPFLSDSLPLCLCLPLCSTPITTIFLTPSSVLPPHWKTWSFSCSSILIYAAVHFPTHSVKTHFKTWLFWLSIAHQAGAKTSWVISPSIMEWWLVPSSAEGHNFSEFMSAMAMAHWEDKFHSTSTHPLVLTSFFLFSVTFSKSWREWYSDFTSFEFVH